MAATWTIQITVIDWPTKHASVTGIRTDGADVRTYTIDTRVTGTPAAEKLRITNDLWALYLADKALKDQIAAAIGSWQADIGTALNAKEV
jgi:hypothetical protein